MTHVLCFTYKINLFPKSGRSANETGPDGFGDGMNAVQRGEFVACGIEMRLHGFR